MNSSNSSFNNDIENTLYFSFDHENKGFLNSGIKSVNKENKTSETK
jgi:hypothetical protein